MEQTTRNKLWEGVFVKALICVKGKLRGTRTSEKKLVETIVFLVQTKKTLDNLYVNEDGEVKKRSMNKIYQECLDKYDASIGKKGEFNPLTDTRDLMQEAQEKLTDAINYLGMALIKIEAVRENAKEDPESDPFHYDVEDWVKRTLDDISLEEAKQVAA